jgi:hypothetical protein
MASETFLVQSNQRAGSRGVKQIKYQIKELKGEILIEIRGGTTMIVILDSQYRELLAGFPLVSFVGGVQFQPPEIKRIQVPRSK